MAATYLSAIVASVPAASRCMREICRVTVDMDVFDYPFGKPGREFVKLGSHDGKTLIFFLNDPKKKFVLLLDILLETCSLLRRDEAISTEVFDDECARLQECPDPVDRELLKACASQKKNSWGRSP